MAQIDTIRAVATYLIAMIVVVGGFGIVYATRGDPASSDTRVVMAGFVGVALQFVFGQEVQTRTARQSASAVANGSAAASGSQTNG